MEVSRGNYPRAIELFQQAARIVGESVGEKHYLLATQANNIGTAMIYDGRKDEAIPFLKKAFNVLFQVDGPESLSVARAGFNLEVVGVNIILLTEKSFGFV